MTAPLPSFCTVEKFRYSCNRSCIALVGVKAAHRSDKGNRCIGAGAGSCRNVVVSRLDAQVLVYWEWKTLLSIWV